MAWRIVLDSMVWAQAAGPFAPGSRGPASEILHLAVAHQFELVTSSYIRAEVLEVLTAAPYFKRRLAPTFDPVEWFDRASAACAEVIDVTGPPVLQEHAKDDPVLWLAAASGASHLVTWEERLLELKHYRFTQIVTPPAFLQAWRHPEAHQPLAEWQALRGPGRLPRHRARGPTPARAQG